MIGAVVVPLATPPSGLAARLRLRLRLRLRRRGLSRLVGVRPAVSRLVGVGA